MFCRNCGLAAAAGDAWCIRCGSRLAAATAPAPSAVGQAVATGHGSVITGVSVSGNAGDVNIGSGKIVKRRIRIILLPVTLPVTLIINLVRKAAAAHPLLVGTTTIVVAGGGIAAGVITLRPSPPPGAELVKDGSFVLPAVRGGGFAEFCTVQSPTPYCSKDPNMGAWRVDAGSVDLYEPGSFGAPPGAHASTQEVDMNGNGPGSISQSLATVPGTSYQLSFELEGNGTTGPQVKTLWAEVNGNVIGKFSFNTAASGTGAGTRWVPEKVIFIPGTSSTDLRFVSTTADSASGPVIADVAVRATP